MNRKFNFVSVFFMCFATAIITLALITAAVFSYFGGREGLVFITKLNTVREIIDSRFVGEVDWENAADGAAGGIVASLDDPWSYYMDSDQYLSYTDRSNNSTTGIGVTVTADSGGRGMYVNSVVENSPADRAGITAGCVITGVAGQSLAGMGVDEVGAIIRAQTGEYSIVFLSAEGEEVSALISNELVYTSPVSFEMIDNNIGYIRISDFERGACEDGIAAVESLREQGAEALIFDVRSNPGGKLTELTGLLDYLLPEGELFVSVDPEGDEEIYTSGPECVEMPMAVLINKYSISAAEFFAAAMREYDWAQLVGEPSTGKARSQQTFVLTDDSAVHISTKSYLTPNRVNLAEAGGLMPDIQVVAEGGEDTQLLAAVEYLS